MDAALFLESVEVSPMPSSVQSSTAIEGVILISRVHAISFTLAQVASFACPVTSRDHTALPVVPTC